MTTTPLIPANALGPAQEAPAPPASQQADDSPAFRDVLASQSVPRQDASARKDGAKEPASPGKSPSGDTVVTDKPAQPGKKTDDKKSRAEDESAATSPGLPGIALYLAAEGNAALSHPAPGGHTKAADASRGASLAKPGRAEGTPPGQAAAPGSLADLPASLAGPATASAGPRAEPAGQTRAAGGTASDTGPAPIPTHGAPQPASGHERTTLAATVPATSPAKAASTHPAGLPGADPDSNPLHAISDSTRRTLAHAGPESAPTLLAATPATATLPPNPSTTLTGATPAISVPLQSPHWPGELGKQFVAIAQSSQPGLGHTAQLRLDPPNLGPLHIAIHVSDNVAQAVFFSPHAQVRQAVENALPQLQQQLAQAGIALGQASVSDQGAPRQDFSDDNASPPRRRTPGSIAAVAMASDAPGTPRQVRASTGNALVDTFA